MYGLVGYPLSHSFSPDYFSQKFRKEKIKGAAYKLFPVKDINDLRRQLPENILGFNVTIPHKESIIPLLDQIDALAKSVNAVNTVFVIDGKWIGYNTDVCGFQSSLTSFIGRRKIAKALILGSGGAAKAVKYVLKDMGIKVSIVSRKRGYRSYHKLTKKVIDEHRLIVNTTPLGMFPNVDTYPDLPYPFIGKKHLLFDLNYNPKKTLFLKKGEESGALIMNGLEMLKLQAEASWSIWNNAPIK